MTGLSNYVWFVESSHVAASVAVNLLLQSTLIIAVGLLAARMLRRQGAAVQSTILRVTLVALLLCPLATWSLSRIGVRGFRVSLPSPPVPTAELSPTSVDADQQPLNEEALRSIPVASEFSPADPRRIGSPLDDRIMSPVQMQQQIALQGELQAAREAATAAQPPAISLAPSTSSSTPPAAPAISPAIPWSTLTYSAFAGLWLVLSSLLLLRLLVANWRIYHARRNARPAAQALLERTEQLAQQLGIVRPQVRISNHLHSPCLVGWWRAVILIPRELEMVSDEVLAHELAHLARRDCLWTLLTRVSSAVLPFQPLLWRLARRMDLVADEVCDDFVVAHTQNPTDYARQLVDIAERLPPTWSVASSAVGVVSFKSSLASRVLRILDTSRILSTQTGVVALLLILAFGLCGLTAVGMIGAASADATSANAPLDADAENSASSSPQETGSGDDLSATTPSPVNRLSGRVSGPDGQPVAGAAIYGNVTAENVWTELARSDADGNIAFELTHDDLRRARENYDGAVQLVAVADALGFVRLDMPESLPASLEFPMQRDVPVRGRLVDVEGRPVVNAEVVVHRVFDVAENNLDRFLSDVNNEQANPYALLQNPWDGPLPGADRVVRTDNDGRFSMQGFGAERLVFLEVTGSGIEHNGIYVMTRQTAPVVLARETINGIYFPPTTYYGATFEHVPAPERVIRGVVRDKQTGQPIAGARVRHYQLPRSQPITDEAGHFELRGHAKAATYQLAVFEAPSPYFLAQTTVSDQPGLDPLQVDFELVRGTIIRGRVTSKSDGRPIRGKVRYEALFPNSHIMQLGDHVHSPCAQAEIQLDGSYEIPVLPGPGVLLVLADDANAYRRAAMTAEQVEQFFADGQPRMEPQGFLLTAAGGPGGQATGGVSPSLYHAVSLLNTADDVTTPAAQNFELVSAAATAQDTANANAANDTENVDTENADAAPLMLAGQVTGPDGRAVASAAIYYWHTADDKPMQIATTNEEGTFSIVVDQPPLLEAVKRKNTMRFAATAADLGFNWIDVAADELDKPFSIQLVSDVPIEGQLVTSDGQPIADALVHIGHIRQPNDPKLDEYIDAVRTSDAGFWRYRDNQWNDRVPGQTQVRTDANGRFRITGVGGERIVLLSLKGANLHNWWIVVVTRNPGGEEDERGVVHLPEPPHNPHYWSQFTHVSAPSRTLRGIVRDQETGEPIADVHVLADFYTSNEVRTDASGKFELIGCRKNDRYYIKARPRDTSYFHVNQQVRDQSGLEPIDVTIDLVRGISARGRVLDNETRQPVKGVVEYYALFPNKNIDRLSGVAHPCSTTPIAEDGSYEVQVLPGPGVITVRNYDDKYAFSTFDLQRVNEMLGAVVDGNNHEFLMVAVGGQAMGIIGRAQFKVMELINPSEEEKQLDRDLLLYTGQRISGVVKDPAGEAITGVTVVGLHNPHVGHETLTSEEFVIRGLTSAEPRRLIFYHKQRKLGAVVDVPAGHSENVSVTLQPGGAVTGVVVDQDNQPVRKARVALHRSEPVLLIGTTDWAGETDDNGRFLIDGLVPGLMYQGTVAGIRFSVRAQSGETQQLGTLREGDQDTPDLQAADMSTQSAKETVADKAASQPVPVKVSTEAQEVSAAAPVAAADVARQVRGRVLDPNGNAVAGARVFTPSSLEEVKQQTVSGADGTFAFTLNTSEFQPHRGTSAMPIFARADNLGIGWADMRDGASWTDLVIQLSEDQIITGQVLDTEGRPVVGARLEVTGIMESLDGSLDIFLNAWTQEWHLATQQLEHAVFGKYVDLILGPSRTDEQGRFTMRGAGRERLVFIQVASDSIANSELYVSTRPAFDLTPINAAAMAQVPPGLSFNIPPKIYGPSIQLVVEPSKLIHGTVREAGTGRPLSNVTIAAGNSTYTRTDQQGRYQLLGLRKAGEYRLLVWPDDADAVVRRTVTVPDTAAYAPIQQDIELRPGVVVTGQVIDVATGRGVQSGVRIAPLPDNKFYGQEGYDYYQYDHTMSTTDQDGRFRMTSIPGPVVVMVQATGGNVLVDGVGRNPFQTARIMDEDRPRLTLTAGERTLITAGSMQESVDIHHALKVLEIPEDAQEVQCDLPLHRGTTLEVHIEDADGQPLEGTMVAGVTEAWPITYRATRSSITVLALDPQRPRTLLFYHPERNLAGMLVVDGDESSPTVRLGPAATISGRAVDANGRPIDGADVRLFYVEDTAREFLRQLQQFRPAVVTDADGNFRIDGALPGQQFRLSFRQGERRFSADSNWDLVRSAVGSALALSDIQLGDIRVRER